MDTKLKVNMYGIGFKVAAFCFVLVGLLAVTFGAFNVKEIALYAMPDEYIENVYFDNYTNGINAVGRVYFNANENAEMTEAEKIRNEKYISEALGRGFSFYALDINNNILMSFGDKTGQAWANVASDSPIIHGGWRDTEYTSRIYAVVSKENFDAAKDSLSPNDGRFPFFVTLAGIFMHTFGLAWIAILSGRKEKGSEVTISTVSRIYNDILFALFANFATLYGVGIYGILVMIFKAENIEVVLSIEALVTLSIFGTAIFALIAFWTAATFGIHIKRKQFFRHTLVFTILSWLGSICRKIWKFFTDLIKAFTNKRLKRKLIIVGVIFFIIGVLNSAVIAMLVAQNNPFWLFWVPFSMAVVIVGVVLFFIKQLTSFEKIKQGVAAIRNGDTSHIIPQCKGKELNTLADDINNIGDGLQTAVRIAITSEKMKSELITNVSHDLKTPLTSIISYVDLLSKEENLSAEANDYITVLRTKSECLSNIISDLFDLSKGTSGNIDLTIERLDIKKLIEQTLADMEDKIIASGYTIKQTLPDTAVFILADGKHLYRVFQNLIDNALKYSLPGTRIFTSLSVENDKAIASIQNTAAYEMDFSEGEILERFTRGDKSRVTDGTGLGLSIAEAFSKLCGGSFEVKIDGDQFKVLIGFDVEGGINS